MTRSVTNFLLFLLVFLSPSQLAIHFWPSWSIVLGRPIDYLSPTLFLTDILLLFLVVPWYFRNHHLLTNLFSKRKYPLFFLSLFVFLNILSSASPSVAIYYWIRAAELLLFTFFIICNRTQLAPIILKALLFASLWVCLLAVWQFHLQHSVGGLWTLLGERPLSPVQPNVAKVVFSHWLLLRPYATFPHPNALAGFLLVVFWLLPFHKRPSWLLWRLLIVAVICLSFSRTVIVVLALGLVFKYLSKKILTTIAILITPLLLLFFNLPSFLNSPSFAERQFLINSTFHLIHQHPLLGVGLGNFIPALSLDPFLFQYNYQLLLQPVHNIFLLLLSEVGLPFAILLIIYFLKKFFHLLKPLSLQFKICLLSLILTGTTDHYWLTSYQNRFLLILTLILIFSYFSSFTSSHDRL